MSRQEKKPFEVYIKDIDHSVNFLAKKLSVATRMPFEDAKQELVIEAWKSYESYDPTAAKFITYAVWRMKNRSKTLMTDDINSDDAMEARRLEQAISENEDDVNPLDNITAEPGYSARPTPEVQIVNQEETAYLQLYGVDQEGKNKLDLAEKYLREQADQEKRESKLSTINQNALTIFLKMRYELKQVGDHKIAPKSLTDIANEMGVVVQRVSTIYTQKIKILGKIITDYGIVDQKASQEVKDMAKKEAKKAVKGKKAKDEDEPKTRGRAAQSGGLKDKIDWVDKTFCKKGKTRSDAINGLLEKYPDMSANYAKTLVYTNMKSDNGYDWAPSEHKTDKEKKEKAAGKKAAPTKKASKEKAEKKPAKKAEKAASKKKAKAKDDEEQEEAEDDNEESQDEDGAEDDSDDDDF